MTAVIGLVFFRFSLISLCLLAGSVHADTIWKCQDLQKVPQFSSIQCAPDAVIYVPSKTNSASGLGSRTDEDRRYKNFISEHNARFEADQRKKRRSTEGHNLKRFKSYPTPAR